MKRIVGILLISLIVACTADQAFSGSGNRTGTNGAAELLIPTGTRDIALAGSAIATTSGIDALFANPAGVAAMENSVSLFASHMSYIADIGVDCGAVSANFEDIGVLSLQLKSLSVGDIPITTALTPDGTGATFRPQFFTIGLTYSRRLSDRVLVGATATLISEHMAEVSANGVAFNMGVIYQNVMNIPGLGIGVVVKNIGPQMAFEGPGLIVQATAQAYQRPPYLYNVQAASFELPSTFEVGLGYRASFVESGTLLVSASFQNNSFSDDDYRFGLEYSFQDIFSIRGGYDLAPTQNDQLTSIYGLTFGAGVHQRLGSMDVVFDYAFRSTKFFDNNHVFSLTLGM